MLRDMGDLAVDRFFDLNRRADVETIANSYHPVPDIPRAPCPTLARVSTPPIAPAARKIICTTNAIERLHSQVRKVVRSRAFS